MSGVEDVAVVVDELDGEGIEACVGLGCRGGDGDAGGLGDRRHDLRAHAFREADFEGGEAVAGGDPFEGVGPDQSPTVGDEDGAEGFGNEGFAEGYG